MAVQEDDLRTSRFLHGVEKAFSSSSSLHPADHRKPLRFSSSTNFARTRRKEIGKLLDNGHDPSNESPTAYFSEWTTFVALGAPLAQNGFMVEMAHPLLENGTASRKGIDLVVSQKKGAHKVVPMLGINVKLGQSRYFQRPDRHYFDPEICAPGVYLSLGDWRVNTREGQQAPIRDWLHQAAIPNITGSGKMPHMPQYRDYVIGRITRTLETYLRKTTRYIEGTWQPAPHEPNLFPQNPHDLAVFKEKLEASHAAFAQLATRATPPSDPNTL